MLEVANMYYLKGEQRQALSLYENFEKSFPNSPFLPHAWLKQGEIYLKLEEDDKALSIFQRIMGSEATAKIKIEAEDSIARILEKRGEKEKAAFEYLKLTYLFPAFEERVKDSLKKAAQLLEEVEKYTEAIQVYKKLLNYEEDKGEILKKIEELRRRSGVRESE